MLNEIVFPRNNNHKMYFLMIKNNFIDKMILDTYTKQESYKILTENTFEFWPSSKNGKHIREVNITSSDIYGLGISVESSGLGIEALNLKHKTNFKENFNPFISIRKTKSIANRMAAFKILHKIIYSKNRLKLCGLTESNNCNFCNDVEDSQHMIYECRYVLSMWKQIQEQILVIFNKNLTLTREIIIFGTNTKLDLIINHFKRLLLRGPLK